MDVAVINDRILPMSDLTAPYLDRGIFFGDGVYEVIRSYEGRIFALDEHLERFSHSAAAIQLPPVDLEQIHETICEAFERAGYANARIYFHLTRGSEERNHLPGKNLVPNFFLTAGALKNDEAVKQAGIAVSTQPDWRWKRCDIKSLNLLPNILARIEADKQGAAEAILVDDDGTITEGAGSAFFAIDGKEKTVITRPLGHEILPSITRAKVLKVAEMAGFSTEERTLTPQQAAGCDELFIAVTTKDIVPVTRFDGAVISGGQCGTMTRKLIAAFKEFVHSLDS